MNSSLRWLIWLAVLIGGWSSRSTGKMNWKNFVRARAAGVCASAEENAISAIDWQQLSLEAGKAQLAWLNRLPEVSQMGVFRAEAMETMADLYQTAGRLLSSGGNGRNIVQPDSAPRQCTTPGSPLTATEPPGLVTTSVRVTTGLGDKLMPLLQEIENGSVLRKVEKFTVRSGRADFV